MAPCQLAAALPCIFWGKVHHLNRHWWTFWPYIMIMIYSLGSIWSSIGQIWYKKVQKCLFFPCRSWGIKRSRSRSWSKDWLINLRSSILPLYWVPIYPYYNSKFGTHSLIFLRLTFAGVLAVIFPVAHTHTPSSSVPHVNMLLCSCLVPRLIDR